MADHMQDEADLEALKRWWDENGKGIVAAVVVAVLGTVGWQQYQGFTVSRTEAASDLYAAMLANHLGDGDPDALASLATELRDCLLYTSPSPRDIGESRMPSSA